MKEIVSTLTDIGLTSTEASIYVSGLDAEYIGVQQIAERTGIKRPTIYHALNTLIEKGLIAEKKISGKVSFAMCPPAQIKSYIKLQKEKLAKQEEKLQEILPLLEKRTKLRDKNTSSIVEYKGIEGVKTVLDIAFYSKSHHWDIIAPVNNFLRSHDKEYAKYYLNARSYHRITSRSLWEKKPGARKLSPQEIKERNPRFMPESMQGKFTSMIILFDDKAAIISPLEDKSALLITSKEIQGMLSAMFEAIWNISEKYQ